MHPASISSPKLEENMFGYIILFHHLGMNLLRIDAEDRMMMLRPFMLLTTKYLIKGEKGIKMIQLLKLLTCLEAIQKAKPSK